MKSKITLITVLICILSVCFDGHSQRLGYGFFTPYTEFAFHGTTEDASPVLQAGMDMGAGLYLNRNLGLYAGFGAYRSIRSFNNINRDQNDSKNHTETAAGPKAFIGLDWFMLPDANICPKLSVYAGYRFMISSFKDEPLYDNKGFKNGDYNVEDFEKGGVDIRYIPVMDYSWFMTNYKSVQHTADGFFFGLKAGMNINIKEVAVNVSAYYELSQYHDGAIVGDSQERFGYFDYVNDVPAYRPWTYYNYINNTAAMPFARGMRSVFGISVSFVI